MYVCVYVFVCVYARYIEADLPELVGPCNIDAWSESNLSGEEFNSKYVYLCTLIHLHTLAYKTTPVIILNTGTDQHVVLAVLLCLCRYASSLPVVVRLEHSQEVGDS